MFSSLRPGSSYVAESVGPGLISQGAWPAVHTQWMQSALPLSQLFPLPQPRTSYKAGIVLGWTLPSMEPGVLASLRVGQSMVGTQLSLVSDGVCL